MIDPNNFNLQGYGQPVGGIQDSVGLEGMADENGFFGTNDTNDIFGQTLKTNTDTNEYLGGAQTLQGTIPGANVEMNPYLGDPNVMQGATNIDMNALYGQAQAIPGATADPNAFLGANQGMTAENTNNTNALFGLNQAGPYATVDPNAVTTADPNALYGTAQIPQGATADPNALYGTAQIPQGATADPNTLYGATQIPQGAIADPNSLYGRMQGVTGIPTTAQNMFYGNMQGVPGLVQNQTTTKTQNAIGGQNPGLPNTVQTNNQNNLGVTPAGIPGTVQAYGATAGLPTPTQNAYGLIGNSDLPPTIGTKDFQNTAQPRFGNYQTASNPINPNALQNNAVNRVNQPLGPPQIPENIKNNNGAPIGQPAYQTSSLPINNQIVGLPNTNQNTAQPTLGNEVNRPRFPTKTQPINNPPQAGNFRQNIQNPMLPGAIGHPQGMNNLQYLKDPEGKVLQTQYGQKIIDEDFRRGRPVYDENKKGRQLQNKKNLIPKPIYNVAINNKYNKYGYEKELNSGLVVRRIGVNEVGKNNINKGNGNKLDRLGRGGSYDVYGRGITPLLNKVGLERDNNPNTQLTSNIKDFL